MITDPEQQAGAESLLRQDVDALSIAADRIHRQLQFRRLRLNAASGTTRGDQRQQHTALQLREQPAYPRDPIRWLRLKSSSVPGLSGRVNDED
jgi:hypothetical protein